jgi:hypothetical protein
VLILFKDSVLQIILPENLVRGATIRGRRRFEDIMLGGRAST